MTKVRIEEIIAHLEPELRSALAEAVKECTHQQSFDERELFRTFVRIVGRKTGAWERVPDNYVKLE